MSENSMKFAYATNAINWAQLHWILKIQMRSCRNDTVLMSVSHKIGNLIL